MDAVINKINKHNKKKRLIQYLFITLGVIIVDIGFYFFLDPAKIVIGGTMGLSILITPYVQNALPWFTNSIFLFIINTFALICGLIFLGKDFFLKTIYATIISPAVIFVFEKIFDPTFFFFDIPITEVEGKITALIVGVVLFGLGVGIALKNDGSTGGMDVFQKIISKYLHVPISISMYLTDWTIVFIAGFFNEAGFTYHYQLSSVLFAFIGVFIEAYIIDVICLSARSRRTLYVITNHPNEIKEFIYKELDRGVTFSNVTGAYSGENKTMVICTMDKNEAYRITSDIMKQDPDAFMFVTSCKEVRGEYDKRGLL
ncbi:MAG: YitT family protein [Acholeplasmatales bacterium]|nr:YitT family protein [Acholeplasmatales bacterium]